MCIYFWVRACARKRSKGNIACLLWSLSSLSFEAGFLIEHCATGAVDGQLMSLRHLSSLGLQMSATTLAFNLGTGDPTPVLTPTQQVLYVVFTVLEIVPRCH